MNPWTAKTTSDRATRDLSSCLGSHEKNVEQTEPVRTWLVSMIASLFKVLTQLASGTFIWSLSMSGNPRDGGVAPTTNTFSPALYPDIRHFIISIAKELIFMCLQRLEWKTETLFQGSISPLRLNQTSNQWSRPNIESNSRQMKARKSIKAFGTIFNLDPRITNLRCGSGLRNKSSIITPYVPCVTNILGALEQKEIRTDVKERKNENSCRLCALLELASVIRE